MGTFTGTRDWIDAFRADPLRRLDRVLRHYDTISPYERGDAHDAADMALKERGTPEDRAAADRALAAWLSARIAEPPTVIADTGWNAYVTHLMEGFALAVRLRGPATGALLRDRYEEFDAWTHGLSDEGSGDVRARYLLALAHNQGATRRFLGVWYRLCDGAGRSDLDGFYRTVGLLGLRRLPAPDGAPPIAEVLEGLARWARHLPDTAEAREHFLLEWHAVSDGYPLTPESWRLLVAPIASAFAARPFVGWWREDVGITHEAGGIAPIHEPTIADTFELTRRLVVLNGEALDRAVTTFVGWQVRFAEVSRSTYTLERSLNVLGNALLRKDTPTAVGLALRLAVTALEHAPNHEPSWVLWAKALLRCGRPEAAESVLWRAIERFPDNAVVRTELAEMLEDRERAAEAEVLYRDTITRFPDDDVAPTALAKLLADTGRTQQAEALYRDTRERFPKDPVCRLALGLLLLDQGRTHEVRPILSELRALDATQAKTLAAHLDAVTSDRPRPHRGADRVPPADQRDSGEEAGWQPLLVTGRALRAAFLLSPALDRKGLVLVTPAVRETLRETARAMLKEAVARDPNNPVVRMIARRHGIADVRPLAADEARIVAGRNFALRLELALHDQDEQAFAWLWEDFRDADRKALTATGWLLLDPYADGSPEAGAAADHLNQWLKRPLAPTALPAVAYLHDRLRNRLPAWARSTETDTFLEGWQNVAPDDVRALIDIALLGLVVAELPLPPVHEAMGV